MRQEGSTKHHFGLLPPGICGRAYHIMDAAVRQSVTGSVIQSGTSGFQDTETTGNCPSGCFVTGTSSSLFDQEAVGTLGPETEASPWQSVTTDFCLNSNWQPVVTETMLFVRSLILVIHPCRLYLTSHLCCVSTSSPKSSVLG